jgi:hypothetical protein
VKILLACLLCLFILPLNLTNSEARSLTGVEKDIAILTHLMESNDTNIPVFTVGNENGVLFVGIDDKIANQPLEVYKQRLVAIVGNVPMDVQFGNFVPTPTAPETAPPTFSLLTKFTASTENSTIKDLYLRYFDSNGNKTIPHVSSFITITQDNKTLFRELLHTHTGILKVNITPTNSTTWTVYAYREPVLGGWVPPNVDDPILVKAAVGKSGLYHIHVEVFSIYYENNIIDTVYSPQRAPVFDSWWFIDNAGNISKFEISKLAWMKDTYEWWLSGKISDKEFTSEIQYWMDSKIIPR